MFHFFQPRKINFSPNTPLGMDDDTICEYNKWLWFHYHHKNEGNDHFELTIYNPRIYDIIWKQNMGLDMV